MSKDRTRRWLRLGLALGLLVAGILLSLGVYGWRRLHLPYRGYLDSELRIDIPRGLDASEILTRLEERGVLPDARLARLYLVYHLGDPPLKAGEYRFAEPLSTAAVLERLIRGQVITYPVTLIEGLTLEETAARLADSGFGDDAAFVSAMRSPQLIADLDPQAEDLEGYLFPDTYHFARGTSEHEIVATLVDTFRRLLLQEVAPLREEDDTRSVRELVILASIVEKEAQLDDERPVIAGVYFNRLHRGIALHADPTIIFALKRMGRWDGNLRRPDLKLDSPYNTYIHPGLPPGPIASPGLASLKAAGRPAEVPYLYFVSRNDGSHVFAETLAEHNRNVHRWQKVYWRERWAEERRQKSQVN